jgi:hypothetical protein
VLRLTLRSGRDGRLLARVVERDGLLFVLDFGDPVLMTDASRRVLHGGFTVDWQGRTETALPSTPPLLRQLALHYAAQGVLVFVDEPDFPRAAPVAISPAGASLRPLPLSANLPTLLPDEPWEQEQDCNTVLRSRRELQELQDRIDATLNTGPQMPYGVVEIDGDGGDDDAVPGPDEEVPTEEVSRLDPFERG